MIVISRNGHTKNDEANGHRHYRVDLLPFSLRLSPHQQQVNSSSAVVVSQTHVLNLGKHAPYNWGIDQIQLACNYKIEMFILVQ